MSEGLPRGWALARLGDIADAQLGKMLDSKRQTGEHAVPYLRNINVRWGSIDTNDLLNMDVAPSERERYSVRDGDLLVCEGGEPGRCAIVSKAESGLAYQKALHRVRPHEGIESGFLAAWLQAVALSGLLEGEMTGSTIKHLPRERIRELIVPVPPTSEQRRIAEALRAAVELHRYLADSLSALEKRLAAWEDSWASATVTSTSSVEPGDEVARRLRAEGIEPQTTIPNDFPQLPTGWHWCRLGDIAKVSGGVTKDAKKQDAAGMVEVPYLRVANVQRGRLRLDDVATIRVSPAKLEALRLLPGDVLMNEGGDRDKLGRGWVWEGQIPDCINQNHVFRVRVKDGLVDPRLLSWFANTWGRRYFEAHGKQTTNLASISMSTLKSLPVPVAPRAAQTEQVDNLVDGLDRLRRIQSVIRALRLRVDRLETSLLTAAVEGRLVPQDPTDEPADVLLQRLAAEREAVAADPMPARTVRKRAAAAATSSEEKSA